MTVKRFAVLGAGSWGTAIAIHLARFGHVVTLYGRDKTQIEAMREKSSNHRYLPGIALPASLLLTDNLAQALHEAEVVVLGVPTAAVRPLLNAMIPHVSSLTGLIWLSKGFDPDTADYLSATVMNVLGEALPIALLTGPSFAKDVAQQKPTAVVIASTHKPFAMSMQRAFHDRYFRTYYSADLNGAELGGAIKNVLAIAVGVADGLQCGANARAALITRGLVEMRRLGRALGVQDDTLTGLSGMGDLILTCTDDQSRNRRFGVLLGQGHSLSQAKAHINQSIEGLISAKTVYQKGVDLHVSLPISEHVYRLLYDHLNPTEALESLLQRDVGEEQ